MTAPLQRGSARSQLLPSTFQLDSLTLDKLDHDALASWLKLLSLPTRKELSRQLSTGEKKISGDGAPKLQISVPCRGRTCPELHKK